MADIVLLQDLGELRTLEGVKAAPVLQYDVAFLLCHPRGELGVPRPLGEEVDQVAVGVRVPVSWLHFGPRREDDGRMDDEGPALSSRCYELRKVDHYARALDHFLDAVVQLPAWGRELHIELGIQENKDEDGREECA